MGIADVVRVSGSVARTFPARGFFFINGDDGILFRSPGDGISQSGSCRASRRSTMHISTVPDRRASQAKAIEFENELAELSAD